MIHEMNRKRVVEVIENYTGVAECRVCNGAGSWPSDTIYESYLGTTINTREWDFCDYCNGDGCEMVKNELVGRTADGKIVCLERRS